MVVRVEQSRRETGGGTSGIKPELGAKVERISLEIQPGAWAKAIITLRRLFADPLLDGDIKKTLLDFLNFSIERTHEEQERRKKAEKGIPVQLAPKWTRNKIR